MGECAGIGTGIGCPYCGGRPYGTGGGAPLKGGGIGPDTSEGECP